jgi:hypothetical protein
MNPHCVYVINAYLAGLISSDQQNTPIEEIKIRGDMASLIQFAELMVQSEELEEHYEFLKKQMKEKYG